MGIFETKNMNNSRELLYRNKNDSIISLTPPYLPKGEEQK